jgi:iron complex transport system ATP-binding protein
LLREINREGLAIVMVSHDINFVSESCVHVKILSEGKLRGEGTPHEVITEQHLAQSFHIRAIVDLNPVTAAPRMTPLSRLCEAADFPQNA